MRGHLWPFILFTLWLASSHHVVTANSSIPRPNHTDVLLELYQQLNGAQWSQPCAWDFSQEDYCQWNPVVVSCDANEPGEVLILRFTNCLTNGTVPASLAKLTKLQRLFFNSKYRHQARNVMDPRTALDFSSFRRFPKNNLRILNMDRRQIGSSIPEVVADLTKLRDLVLPWTSLAGKPGLPKLGMLTELRNLHLNDNNIEDEIPPEFGSLTKLTSLNLKVNKLYGELPAELGNMTKLQRFRVDFNQLSGTLPSAVGNMDNLAIFDVSGNFISGVIPSEFGMLKKLSALLMSNCSLGGKIPAELKHMEGLNRLVLSHNRITSTPLREWSMLFPDPPLWTVPGPHDCENRTYDLRIYRPDPEHQENIFAEIMPSRFLTNLVLIDLSHNWINLTANAVLRGLSGLGSLAYLDLSNNRLHGQNQLHFLTSAKNIMIQGSPSLDSADDDLPCKDRRLDFSIGNKRRPLQTVSVLNLANNPEILADNVEITFEDMALLNLNISGNVGITGVLWSNAQVLDVFDATRTGFDSVPDQLQIDYRNVASAAAEMTCYAFGWTNGNRISVDSSLVDFQNCVCSLGYESSGSECIPCKPGYATEVTDDTDCTRKNCTCSVCKPGFYATFNSLLGRISCQTCPSGTFQDNPGQETCHRCPYGTVPNTNQTACIVRSGFWRMSLNSTDKGIETKHMVCYTSVLQAESGESFCLGANVSNVDHKGSSNYSGPECAAGADSTLCLSCIENFTKQSSGNLRSPCVECTGDRFVQSLALLFVFMLCVFVAILFALKESASTFHRTRSEQVRQDSQQALYSIDYTDERELSTSAVLRLLYTHLQITSTMASLPTQWPSINEIFFSLTDTFGMGSLNLNCLSPFPNTMSGSFTFEAIIAIVLPLACAFCSWIGIVCFTTFSSGWKNLESFCDRRVHMRMIVASAAIGTSLHYYCVRTGLELLPCISNDAEGEVFVMGFSYVRLDPQHRCWSQDSTNMAQLYLSLVLLLLYGLGFPLWLGYLIHADVNRRTTENLRYLYADFLPGLELWEVVVLFIKSVFVAVVILPQEIDAGVHISSAMSILVVNCWLQSHFKPYKLASLNFMSMLGTAIQILTVYLGFFLRAPGYDEAFAGGLVIITNSFYSLALCAIAVTAWLKKPRSCVRALSKSHSAGLKPVDHADSRTIDREKKQSQTEIARS